MDVISPKECDKRPTPSRSLDQFPLKEFLELFSGGDEAVPGGKLLAKRLVQYLIWASCLPVTERTDTWSTATRSIPPKGPTLLLLPNLAVLVDSFQAWEEFEPILLDAVKGMCAHGSANAAIEFVDKLTDLSQPSESVKTQVCSRVAALVCEHMLAAQQPSSTNPTASLLPSYKRLFLLLARYSPLKANQFVIKAQNLDVDKVLLPLVVDNGIRKAATGTSEMKQALDSLTKHCADVLSARTRDPLGSVEVWTLPAHIPIPRNSHYSSFLKNPCQQVFDWQVRKSDHKGFIAELSALIRAGEVKTESHQPAGRGAYHFRITKLKRRTIPALSFAAMTCSCSSRAVSSSYGRSNYGYHRYNSSATSASNCLFKKHKAAVEKRNQDEKALAALTKLLPPELRELLGTRKRQATVAAPTNDGNIVAQGTGGAVDLTSSPGRSQSVAGGTSVASQNSGSTASKKPKHTNASADGVIDLT